MKICKACGVELDDDMQVCPLCDTSVSNDGSTLYNLKKSNEASAPEVKKRPLLHEILWQITAILLLSGIAATLVINLAIQGRITWSVYPVTICLMLLSYVSLMSIWRAPITYRLAGGWLMSAMILLAIYVLADVQWPLMLALPILFAVNMITFLLIFIVRILPRKGLNVFAIVILGIAILCIIIEGIITYNLENTLRLQWSAIVSACLLPVTATIIFMYFRTKNNNELKKIFHT